MDQREGSASICAALPLYRGQGNQGNLKCLISLNNKLPWLNQGSFRPGEFFRAELSLKSLHKKLPWPHQGSSRGVFSGEFSGEFIWPGISPADRDRQAPRRQDERRHRHDRTMAGRRCYASPLSSACMLSSPPGRTSMTVPPRPPLPVLASKLSSTASPTRRSRRSRPILLNGSGSSSRRA